MVANDSSAPAGAELRQLFTKKQLSGLPTIAPHARELLALANSSQSNGEQLARAILKDFSLTSKVLQVVNSALYGLPKPVNSIGRAVVILGYEAVRDLACAMAIFENLLQGEADRETVCKLLTASYLSGLQARDLAEKTKVKVLPESAFLSALLHNLGKIIVAVHLPESYARIIAQAGEAGEAEEAAVRAELAGMSWQEVGEAVGKLWNLPPMVVACMGREKVKPRNQHDSQAHLHNLVGFANRFVDLLCRGEEVAGLLHEFADLLRLEEEELVEIFKKNVEYSEDSSPSIRFGLGKLQVHRQLEQAERRRAGLPAVEIAGRQPRSGRGGRAAAGAAASLGELGDERLLREYILKIKAMMSGPFGLNDFYRLLLEGLERGVGFDRVVLAIVKVEPDRISLVGRYGLGEIDGAGLNVFDFLLTDLSHALTQAVRWRKDDIVPANREGAFPDKLRYLTKDREVHLLPIVVGEQCLGLIYADRKAARPPLSGARINASRFLRDLAGRAIQQLRGKK